MCLCVCVCVYVPGLKSLCFPNNSHIIESDRTDLLFKVNVEFLHCRHVVSIRGITSNLLIFLKKENNGRKIAP